MNYPTLIALAIERRLPVSTTTIALVAAAQGIAIMPQEAAALPHPQVVFVSLHHPVYYARSTAVWRKETPHKSLDKYLKILFEHIQD